MRGLRGVGLRGLADPVLSAVCLSGLNAWNFDPTLVSMTASMAKRLTSVFAASPIVQGKRYGTGTPDSLAFLSGTGVLSNFYTNMDWNQGSICFRLTPEWNYNDGLDHLLLAFPSSAGINLLKHSSNILRFQLGGSNFDTTPSFVAGTTYNICVRWNIRNTIDGTNYVCISINDSHSFGYTNAASPVGSSTTLLIGSYNSLYPASALIEGLTVYRRVLYDGTYGVNVGNGDEVALIAAGVDPTTVTGSWDVVFCLPTNASAGALTTGTGNAWSHPHSSNLLTRGFLNDRYYGGTNQWAVKFNGTSTSINCGSGATLDDLPSGANFQVEGWFLSITGGTNVIISKGSYLTTGWIVGVFGGGLTARIELATTLSNPTILYTADGKWHHFVLDYVNATKTGRLALDGVWGNASVGAGAYNADNASSLVVGKRGVSDWLWNGSIGWLRLSSVQRYTPGTNFVPPRTMPAADGSTVEQWALNEGTGTTATASVTTPGNDGTISNGTWEQQWLEEGTPVMLQSVIGSANYNAAVGSDAAIDDMADNAFTADGWFRVPKTGAVKYLTGKGTFGTNGWHMQITAAGLLSAKVECATTDATVASTARWDDSLWHYFKMTFDDAGDRKVYIYVDNVDVSSGAVAGVGAIVSDAAQNGYIGYTSTSLTGAHGWVRWSNSVRGAGMIERSSPPAADGNTLAQWNCTEGAGATLDNIEGTATRDGAITGTYSWNNSPAMESDSPGARQYAWGYVIGSDAANEGTKQVYSGLTAGSNYVLNAWAYSEDGVAQPCVVIYDETNGAEITRLAGTTTSTDKAPNRLNFSFEIPTIARNGVAADCTSISIKLINLTATGVVGWQQVELL